MPKTICLLSPQEADDLKSGLPVLCKNHRHAGPNKVRQLRYDSYRGSVKPAYTPDGKVSENKVCLREAREWRKVRSRNFMGGQLGTMQFVPTNLPRRQHAQRHRSQFPQSPQGAHGPVHVLAQAITKVQTVQT